MTECDGKHAMHTTEGVGFKNIFTTRESMSLSPDSIFLRRPILPCSASCIMHAFSPQHQPQAPLPQPQSTVCVQRDLAPAPRLLPGSLFLLHPNHFRHGHPYNHFSASHRLHMLLPFVSSVPITVLSPFTLGHPVVRSSNSAMSHASDPQQGHSMH